MSLSHSSEDQARPSRGRAWARRLIAALLVLTVLGLLAHRWAPWLKREIQLRQAERAIEHGRLDHAEALLDLIIHEQPTRTRPRLLMVQVLRRERRITEAEEILQRTIELGLPIEEGRREFALLAASSDFPRAKKSLQRLLEAYPDDQEVRQALQEGQEREIKKR